MKQAVNDEPPCAAGRRPRLSIAALLVAAFAVVGLAGCALPPAPAKQPLEISGTVSNIDVDGRFFYLENEGQRARTVYWDDSTRFSSGGREFAPGDADRMLGESVAVLAVPMGGKMVANSCSEL